MMYISNAIPGSALIGRAFIGRPATAEEVVAAIDRGAASAVGHQSTAEALSTLTGRRVRWNPVTLKLVPGDVLFVAALRGPRLPEGKLLTREEVEARGFDFLRVDVIF